MKCDELYERLTDFVDGTLEGDVCSEVEQHLAECHDCQDVRQDLQDLARLCRQVSAAPAAMPDVLRQRILVLLAEEDAAPPRPSA